MKRNVFIIQEIARQYKKDSRLFVRFHGVSPSNSGTGEASPIQVRTRTWNGHSLNQDLRKYRFACATVENAFANAKSKSSVRVLKR